MYILGPPLVVIRFLLYLHLHAMYNQCRPPAMFDSLILAYGVPEGGNRNRS